MGSWLKSSCHSLEFGIWTNSDTKHLSNYFLIFGFVLHKQKFIILEIETYFFFLFQIQMFYVWVFFFFYLIWISWLYIIILCDNFVNNSLFITKFECHTISTHIYSQSDMRTIQIAIAIQQSFSLKKQIRPMSYNVT